MHCLLPEALHVIPVLHLHRAGMGDMRAAAASSCKPALEDAFDAQHNYHVCPEQGFMCLTAAGEERKGRYALAMPEMVHVVGVGEKRAHKAMPDWVMGV